MRRALAVIAVALAAPAAVTGQTNAQAARQTEATTARQELSAGERAYRGGRYEEAERRFRRALELDPGGKNTRLYIARAVQQQYKPGVDTPENVAAGERAVAAYQEILAKDPSDEDAYRAVVFLYGQMKREDKVRELLLWRANDFGLPDERRAEALTILASQQWQCSYDVTERKENKATENRPDRVVILYKMPADSADFIRARDCATEGMQLAEQAVALAPKNPNAWSYKANLLREVAKLAEMEGDAARKDEYLRRYDEALEAQRRLAFEAQKRVEAGGSRPARREESPVPEPEQMRTILVAPVPAAGRVEGVAEGNVSAEDAAQGGAAAPDGPPAPPPPTGATKTVSGGVLNGKAVSKPQPAYPPDAKAERASGTVTVRVLVDEEGKVVEAEAVSGHPLLQAAAVEAARLARFSPTLLSGQPVRVTGVITYNFVLQQ